ncbi:GGDEF domain-containing protein [Brevibacillus daliensis]|uniref:GGDEF domain-containing protein n=1 Tax=Brevibacillus daliensis TaxID=2892995 RepID=UPI001E2B08A4|nr:diguanylate cyclase [Brevibacillus daliensis]
MSRTQKYTRHQVLEPYLLLTFLVLFMAQYVTFLSKNHTFSFIWFGLCILLIGIGYAKNRVISLAASLVIIFLFGTTLLINYFVLDQTYPPTFLDLVWFGLFPTSAYAGGLLGEQIRRLYRQYQDIYQSVDELMMIDPVTGLSTEKRFFFDLEEEIQREYRHFIRRQRAGQAVGTWKEQDPKTIPADEHATIMLIKIVHYDEFHSLYGEDWGKQLILAVAEGLHSSLRLSDKKARVDRDCFAVILPETPRDNAVIVQNRLREAMEKFQLQLSQFQMKEVRLTLQFGIATTPHQGDKPQELIEAAKQELRYDLG